MVGIEGKPYARPQAVAHALADLVQEKGPPDQRPWAFVTLETLRDLHAKDLRHAMGKAPALRLLLLADSPLPSDISAHLSTLLGELPTLGVVLAERTPATHTKNYKSSPREPNGSRWPTCTSRGSPAPTAVRRPSSRTS